MVAARLTLALALIGMVIIISLKIKSVVVEVIPGLKPSSRKLSWVYVLYLTFAFAVLLVLLYMTHETTMRVLDILQTLFILVASWRLLVRNHRSIAIPH